MNKEEIMQILNINEETIQLLITINEGNAIKVMSDLEKMAELRKANS